MVLPIKHTIIKVKEFQLNIFSRLLSINQHNF